MYKLCPLGGGWKAAGLAVTEATLAPSLYHRPFSVGTAAGTSPAGSARSQGPLVIPGGHWRPLGTIGDLLGPLVTSWDHY